MILGSGDYEELVTRTDYLRRSRSPTPPSPTGSSRSATRSAREAEAGRRAEGQAPTPTTNASPPPARKSPRCAATPRPPPRSCSRSPPRARPRSPTLKSKIGDWVERDRGSQARSREPGSRSRRRSRPLARRPLLDPDLHRDVRVRRQLRRRQPLQRRRRRLPDPALDLGTLRRPGRAPERPQGRTGPDRRRNLGRLRRRRLGLRAEPSLAYRDTHGR